MYVASGTIWPVPLPFQNTITYVRGRQAIEFRPDMIILDDVDDTAEVPQGILVESYKVSNG